jgi:Leucine-rich repeat (LRR) protein
LQCLDISENDLKSLPDEICDLTRLIDLIANDNGIVDLPQRLGKLTALTTLELSNNRLRELPREGLAFRRLKNLYVENNPLNVECFAWLSEIELNGSKSVRRDQH